MTSELAGWRRTLLALGYFLLLAAIGAHIGFWSWAYVFSDFGDPLMKQHAGCRLLMLFRCFHLPSAYLVED